ncbi:MAG: alkaline phosphatase D family protein [Archangium sp.]
MKKLLGPLLYAESCAPDEWKFRVHLFISGKPDGLALTMKGATVSELQSIAKLATGNVKGSIVGWTVTLPRAEKEQTLSYTIKGLDEPLTVKGVRVPKLGELPRFAFFSCNGVSDEKLWNQLDEPYACWSDLYERHEEDGLHLLVGGGDQLYCDSLFETNEHLREVFKHWSKADKRTQPVPAGFADEIAKQYVDLYVSRWSQEGGIVDALARIPSLFTWDDHDVFDGWGSHETLQSSPHYRTMFEAARRAFMAFQLGVPDEKNEHFLTRRDFVGGECDTTFLLLDGRSQRGTDEVLGSAQWRELDAQLDLIAKARANVVRPLHLVVVSSVPVINMSFGRFDEAGSALAGLRDDLLDQWESRHHRGERARLLMTLLNAANDARCAVTILAGDIHVGSRSRVRSTNPRHAAANTQTVIEHVTSSAILHPAPSALQFAGMRAISKKSADDFDPHVVTENVPVGDDLYLRERNWLSGRFDTSNSGAARLWLEFRAESGPISLQTCVRAP